MITIISCSNKPHLSWRETKSGFEPKYKQRLNRQELPKNLIENGAFLITKRDCLSENNRIGKSIDLYIISDKESIDIDSPSDWWIAEKELRKKNIVIRVEGFHNIGLGHIYRGIFLAQNLIDHNVIFILSKKSDLGLKKIIESHFKYKVISNNNDFYNFLSEFECDILINDILTLN